MTVDRPLHVLIAGAGLAGLALAQGLLKSGHTVDVFERDADLNRKQGYYLHFNGIGGNALQRCLPGRPLRALPRHLPRVLRPRRVDRAHPGPDRDHLAAAHGAAELRAAQPHRGAPAHAAADPVRTPRRQPARGQRR